MKEVFYAVAGVIMGALGLCYTIAFLATPVVVCLAAVKYLTN